MLTLKTVAQNIDGDFLEKKILKTFFPGIFRTIAPVDELYLYFGLINAWETIGSVRCTSVKVIVYQKLLTHRQSQIFCICANYRTVTSLR